MLCDVGPEEEFQTYIRRHGQDHRLGWIEDNTEAEANLGVWCLFFQARYVIGNTSLGVGSKIVAHYEPCWEDAEYLANWIFAPEDLEQDKEWAERSFILRPHAERHSEGAVYKRFKKLTKVRDTQKTSWSKAYLTFRQLHAYFIEGRPNYRVLVISATSTLARDHYLEPLKELWDTSANIQRLYGATVYTKKYHALMARRNEGGNVSDDALEAETRRLGLLDKGSRPKDALKLRWLLRQKETSAMSAISLKVMGMETTSGGNRWDLVVIDDPISIENAATEPQRRKVERKIADLRKQGDADSEFLYLNTPYSTDDASAKIDRDQSDQYHILYRPGLWYDSTATVKYYWSYNATDPGKPVPGKPSRNAVWPPERCESEKFQPDFASQVLLRARDANHAIFETEDFIIVDPDNAPVEIVAGLGGMPITDEQKAWLAADNVEIHSYLLIDGAGNETSTHATNAETAIIGARISRNGDIYFVHLEAGRMTATVEENAIFAAWERIQAEVVHYEVVSAGKKMVEKNFARFQAEKSRELGRPIVMPFRFRDAASTKGKEVRVPQMSPYAKQGRLKILANAAPRHVIKKFILQFTDWNAGTPLKDMADAASMIQSYTSFDPYEATQNTARDEAERMFLDENDGTLHMPAAFIFDQINGKHAHAMPWGRRGGVSRG